MSRAPAGGALAVAALAVVAATLPSAGVGPLRFTGIQGTELGRFAVRRAYRPLPGEWELRVSARRGLKARDVGAVTLPIGG